MTTATANKVKAPKKGFKLDRQMIPTRRGRGDLHPDDHHGSGVVRHLHSTGLHLSLFIDHAYLIILAVAMTLPILPVVSICLSVLSWPSPQSSA